MACVTRARVVAECPLLHDPYLGFRLPPPPAPLFPKQKPLLCRPTTRFLTAISSPHPLFQPPVTALATILEPPFRLLVHLGSDPASAHPAAQKLLLGRGPPPPGGPLPSSSWTRHRAVNRGQSGGSIGTPSRGKGRVCGEVRIGQARRGRARGAERPKGTAACGGRGFKGRARVSGERPIGAARCRQQHNPASCQIPLEGIPGARDRGRGTWCVPAAGEEHEGSVAKGTCGAPSQIR